VWWISRRGPRLDIQGFLDATASHNSSEVEGPAKAKPFRLGIVHSGMTQSDDHVLKIQRAFAHFSSIYGAWPKGYFKGTELNGEEDLDGSLFFRAARLTDEYMSESTRSWNFKGFYAK